MILIVDSSSIGIGWVISQQDEEGERNLIGVEMVVEPDCLLVLRIIANCNILN